MQFLIHIHKTNLVVFHVCPKSTRSSLFWKVKLELTGSHAIKMYVCIVCMICTSVMDNNFNFVVNEDFQSFILQFNDECAYSMKGQWSLKKKVVKQTSKIKKTTTISFICFYLLRLCWRLEACVVITLLCLIVIMLLHYMRESCAHTCRLHC